MGRKRTHRQLLFQQIAHVLAHYDGRLVGLVVGRIVVRLQFVVGDLVVAEVVVHGIVVPFVAACLVFPLRTQLILGLRRLRSIFQGRIDLHFLLNPLLQCLCRQLNQLHQLNLLRRQLLLQALAKRLLEHRVLEFCVARGAREGDYVTDITHTCHKLYHSLKA